MREPETNDAYAAQWAAAAEAAERRRYQDHYESLRIGFENNRRQAEAARLRTRAVEHDRRAVEYATYARQLHQAGNRQWADGWQRAANEEARAYSEWRDLADAVLAGTTAPPVVDISATFEHANRDVGALALGAVESAGPSRLTGDDDPPPIDDSRPYGQPGGLRPPLALHQVDVERQVPRDPDGTVTRTADPRQGGWFRLLNDGGPAADATRGINCLDCTLSLFETWVHGRPRVSAPRTFDGYLDGDIRRPIRGEAGGPGRVEDVTGGRFQQLLAPGQRTDAAQARQAADRGYRNLHDQLLLGGHGSYSFLVTEWAHGGSHAWVALNQNGTVLYVDPQNGVVRDRPIYPNVVGIDALVLSGDGRPMPLGGLPRGRFSERPDLPDHPPTHDDGGHGDPYINRMYLLLDGPGSAPQPDGPGGDPTAAEDRGDRGWQAAGPLLPADESGRQLNPKDCEFLGITPDAVLAWADRSAPLGATRAQFAQMTAELFDALREDGLDLSTVDMRLQGSSARFFSGPHKQMPSESELVDNPEALARLQDWSQVAPLPLRRPFDSMYRLGLEEPSDYDFQISSDEMVERARQHGAETYPGLRVVNARYGFVTKKVARECFPHLFDWAERHARDLGRDVVPAIFPGSGPPDRTGTGVSSHFQDSDWIVGEPDVS
ncbi:toxin glutamine deamidase domain-containing protein [Micromonospora trifolii]|uniref:toxin glutamine deamidase domain-containing protein n=1 Tax=Micromonospora trifolii TaxID=2911208 RepID=UPI003D2F34D3